MKILITGGNGYIAKSLYCAFLHQYQVTSITRNDFDLSDKKLVCSWFDNNQYDVVIHTAITGGSRLKEENNSVYENNMKMINNLHLNKHSFKKLITFGSGAEIFHKTAYAKSKKDINSIINSTDNWFNLRIFGVFNENELNTRFIKSNIIRYLKKEPLVIHKNKIMDFFYMSDLISLINFYIKNDDLPKEINCSYEEKYTLKNIADIINKLDNYSVPVIIENKKEFEFYCGDASLPINTVGLKSGITETFNKLKNNTCIMQ
jgi:nucleoside-diphosphate-sugar epimerase